MSKRQADQLSVTRRFFSLPSIFPRHKENFCMITYINPAVTWVSLFHRCVRIILAYELYVSFNLDYAVIKNRLQCSKYLPCQIFRMTKSNDFKSSTFVAMSFFLDLLLSFMDFFYFMDIVVSALKIASLAGFACSFNIAIHMTSPYMQSNSNLLSMKIEQLTVLIYNANRQIYNASCDDRYR